MDKDALQNDIVAWHRRNYPKDDQFSALLGVQEEIGELNRAELKQEGGIRGTWDEWQIEKHKEAGDVLIGILNFCGFRGIKISDALKAITSLPPVKDQKLALLLVSISFGQLVDNATCGLGQRTPWFIGSLYRDVESYCYLCGFDPNEVLILRWETISKRDFIANPATGGRENES